MERTETLSRVSPRTETTSRGARSGRDLLRVGGDFWDVPYRMGFTERIGSKVQKIVQHQVFGTGGNAATRRAARRSAALDTEDGRPLGRHVTNGTTGQARQDAEGEGSSMNFARLRRLAVVGAAVALAVPAVAQANEVTKWNEIATNTVLAQPPITSAPPAAAVFMGMVQGAVYGAVNAIDRHGRPYLVTRSFPMASTDAAAATAAFRVLDTLFPAQHATLQTQYDASLAAIAAGSLKDTGVEVGTAAADAMLAEGHDGREVIPCAFATGAGVWQPLAGPTGAPLCDPSPWVANGVTFMVESASQFRTDGPFPLASAAYAADFNEVKELGSLNSTTRTPEQTHIAVFWQSNPAATYNAVARRFAEAQSLDVTESARLFGMLNLTAADTQTNCWNDKYSWNFWRPITAIHQADIDGNPATVADPNWKPLFDPSLDPAIAGVGPALITAPYPEHPSGAACYGSASMHAFQSFFGTDEMTFYVTSSRFPGEQRTFNRFSDVIKQLIEARIWTGIHFRNADVQAANLGRRSSATFTPTTSLPRIETGLVERLSGRSTRFRRLAHPPGGWQGHLAHDPREDAAPYAVFYCPDCAEREFGQQPREVTK
jgi:hypothetical protein